MRASGNGQHECAQRVKEGRVFEYQKPDESASCKRWKQKKTQNNGRQFCSEEYGGEYGACGQSCEHETQGCEKPLEREEPTI